MGPRSSVWVALLSVLLVSASHLVELNEARASEPESLAPAVGSSSAASVKVETEVGTPTVAAGASGGQAEQQQQVVGKESPSVTGQEKESAKAGASPLPNQATSVVVVQANENELKSLLESKNDAENDLAASTQQQATGSDAGTSTKKAAARDELDAPVDALGGSPGKPADERFHYSLGGQDSASKPASPSSNNDNDDDDDGDGDSNEDESPLGGKKEEPAATTTTTAKSIPKESSPTTPSEQAAATSGDVASASSSEKRPSETTSKVEQAIKPAGEATKISDNSSEAKKAEEPIKVEQPVVVKVENNAEQPAAKSPTVAIEAGSKEASEATKQVDQNGPKKQPVEEETSSQAKKDESAPAAKDDAAPPQQASSPANEIETPAKNDAPSLVASAAGSALGTALANGLAGKSSSTTTSTTTTTTASSTGPTSSGSTSTTKSPSLRKSTTTDRWNRWPSSTSSPSSPSGSGSGSSTQAAATPTRRRPILPSIRRRFRPHQRWNGWSGGPEPYTPLGGESSSGDSGEAPTAKPRRRIPELSTRASNSSPEEHADESEMPQVGERRRPYGSSSGGGRRRHQHHGHRNGHDDEHDHHQHHHHHHHQRHHHHQPAETAPDFGSRRRPRPPFGSSPDNPLRSFGSGSSPFAPPFNPATGFGLFNSGASSASGFDLLNPFSWIDEVTKPIRPQHNRPTILGGGGGGGGVTGGHRPQGPQPYEGEYPHGSEHHQERPHRPNNSGGVQPNDRDVVIYDDTHHDHCRGNGYDNDYDNRPPRRPIRPPFNERPNDYDRPVYGGGGGGRRPDRPPYRRDEDEATSRPRSGETEQADSTSVHKQAGSSERVASSSSSNDSPASSSLPSSPRRIATSAVFSPFDSLFGPIEDELFGAAGLRSSFIDKPLKAATETGARHSNTAFDTIISSPKIMLPADEEVASTHKKAKSKDEGKQLTVIVSGEPQDSSPVVGQSHATRLVVTGGVSGEPASAETSASDGQVLNSGRAGKPNDSLEEAARGAIGGLKRLILFI